MPAAVLANTAKIAGVPRDSVGFAASGFGLYMAPPFRDSAFQASAESLVCRPELAGWRGLSNRDVAQAFNNTLLLYREVRALRRSG